MSRMKTIQEMWGIEATAEKLKEFFENSRVSAQTTIDRTAQEPVILYLNQGRWVADCPFCNGGMPGHPESKVIACPDCGSLYRADIPKKADIAKAEEVLLQREHDTQLNWNRQNGEDVRDLQAENAVRGISF